MEERTPHVGFRIGKRIWQAALIALMIPLFLAFVREPLSARSGAMQAAQYRETVISVFEALREDVASRLEEGVKPRKLGDMEEKAADGSSVVVRQVKDDQHWVNGSVEGGTDAVYMVDRTGQLVYYSFRSDSRASTWSGPSTDEDFIASHGGWIGGMGAGWTGYPVM